MTSAVALTDAELVAAPAEAVASPDDGLALPDALTAADALAAAVDERVDELQPVLDPPMLTVADKVARDALGQPLTDGSADLEGVEGTDGDEPLECDESVVDDA